MLFRHKSKEVRHGLNMVAITMVIVCLTPVDSFGNYHIVGAKQLSKLFKQFWPSPKCIRIFGGEVSDSVIIEI